MHTVQVDVCRAQPPLALLPCLGEEGFRLQVRGAWFTCSVSALSSASPTLRWASSSAPWGLQPQGPGASQHLRLIVGVFFPHPQRGTQRNQFGSYSASWCPPELLQEKTKPEVYLPKSGWKNHLHNWALAPHSWFSSWGCKIWEVRGLAERASGPEGEGSGWVTVQGKAAFFQVKLTGRCKWQKGRLEVASPTLADSFN